MTFRPLGTAGNATHLSLVPPDHGKYNDTNAPTSISLFDQGLVQMLQAAVSGLQPNHPYVLALSRNADGSGPLVPPLQQFKTWAAGAALVNTIGPIRQILQENVPPRYLVIVPGTAHQHGLPVQTQLSNEVVRP